MAVISDKGKKGDKGYAIHPLWKWVLFLAIVIYCGVTILTQQAKINEQKRISEENAALIKELEEQIESLENELAYMGTDEYVERTARERLGMIKEGEIIFKEQKEGEQPS